MKFLFLTVVLAAGWSAGFASRLVCYYANWSRYESGSFKIEDIDPTLCTHIVYDFFALDDNSTLVSRDAWNDLGDEWSEGGLKRFLKLKNKNPSVKLLIGIGGWNEGPLAFINTVRSPEKRKIFLESCVQFLRTFKFDGVEIDWLYTDSWGGSELDKEGYSQLVREMKPVFEKNGYVLGVATSVDLTVVKNSYDLATLSKYVDYIYALTFDYHGSWEKKTSHGAPLYGKNQLSVSDTINSFIRDLGAIPQKLNLGVVTYGRSFTLKNPGCSDYETDAKGPGLVNPMPYRVFCDQDKKGVWTKFRNDKAAVPYSVAGDQWVGQEDITSLTDKVKFAKSKKLGGISFWRLDYDDFRGNCDSVKFPLLKAVRAEMLK